MLIMHHHTHHSFQYDGCDSEDVL